MPVIIPTNNQSPDATLGGLTVTTPTNVGHATTQTVSEDGGSTLRSCRWFGFPAASGGILKVGYESDGLLTGAGASNSFIIEYSTNAGGAWTVLVQRDNVANDAQNTTATVNLAGVTDSNVQVRTSQLATTVDVGENAQTAVKIVSIRIEIDASPPPVVIM